MKRELEQAEWEAKNRKRVKAGLEALPRPGSQGVALGEDQKEEEEARRRREAIAQAIELDRDSDAASSDSDSSSDEDHDEEEEKPNATATSNHDNGKEEGEEVEDEDDSSDSDSDSDSEDEQTLLLRELEKIKSERAAEKQRLSALAASTAALTAQEEIARGNPLLNLQAAFSSSTPSSNSTSSANGREQRDFGVKKRWDHDVIFKNQAEAAGHSGRDAKAGFVNDLTRSEFHKKFINRYIK